MDYFFLSVLPVLSQCICYLKVISLLTTWGWWLHITLTCLFHWQNGGGEVCFGYLIRRCYICQGGRTRITSPQISLKASQCHLKIFNTVAYILPLCIVGSFPPVFLLLNWLFTCGRVTGVKERFLSGEDFIEWSSVLQASSLEVTGDDPVVSCNSSRKRLHVPKTWVGRQDVPLLSVVKTEEERSELSHCLLLPSFPQLHYSLPGIWLTSSLKVLTDQHCWKPPALQWWVPRDRVNLKAYPSSKDCASTRPVLQQDPQRLFNIAVGLYPLTCWQSLEKK